jgi:MFS family permease
MTAAAPAPDGFRGFQGWRALRHRNYRLFYGGQLISLIGTWMMTVAQSWLVLQLTHEPWVLGVVAAAQFLPVLVLGLFGGLIADSLPKRRTLVATQGFAMILGLIMSALVLTHTVQVWHVLVVAFLLGCRNAVDMPTRQAFVVEMVGREDISNAVALNSAMFNGARVIGPAVAGLTIGLFDVGPAFLLDALSYLAVIVALLAMREGDLDKRPGMERPESARAVLHSLREGLSYVRRTRVVLVATLVIGLVSTFGMNFTVVIPPLVETVLHSDATGYGFLMAAMGVGSMISALTIAFSGRTTPLIIGIGAAMLGVAEVVLGFTSSFPGALVLMFIAGVGGIGMAATANTVIQLSVPDVLRGRVMSVYTTVFAGSTPIGGLLAGAIASTFGAAVAIGVGGAASLLTGLGAIRFLRGRPMRQPKPTARRVGSPAIGDGVAGDGVRPI